MKEGRGVSVNEDQLRRMHLSLTLLCAGILAILLSFVGLTFIDYLLFQIGLAGIPYELRDFLETWVVPPVLVAAFAVVLCAPVLLWPRGPGFGAEQEDLPATRLVLWATLAAIPLAIIGFVLHVEGAWRYYRLVLLLSAHVPLVFLMRLLARLLDGTDEPELAKSTAQSVYIVGGVAVLLLAAVVAVAVEPALARMSRSAADTLQAYGRTLGVIGGTLSLAFMCVHCWRVRRVLPAVLQDFEGTTQEKAPEADPRQ